jgi:translocation and assembly module TamA
LGHTALALSAAPVAAAVLGSQPAAQEADGDEDEGAVEAATQPPLPASPPEPEPVPDSLDALIPEAALADPEGWAAGGVANPAAVAGPADSLDPLASAPDPAFDAAFAGLEAAADGAPLPEGEAALAELAIPDPQPLPPDPELKALASIDAPVLAAAPELAETRVNATLVLALPADPEALAEAVIRAIQLPGDRLLPPTAREFAHSFTAERMMRQYLAHAGLETMS